MTTRVIPIPSGYLTSRRPYNSRHIEAMYAFLHLPVRNSNSNKNILSDQYVGHSYFSLESPESWINPRPLEAYMLMTYGPFKDYRGRRQDSTPSVLVLCLEQHPH